MVFERYGLTAGGPAWMTPNVYSLLPNLSILPVSHPVKRPAAALEVTLAGFQAIVIIAFFFGFVRLVVVASKIRTIRLTICKPRLNILYAVQIPYTRQWSIAVGSPTISRAFQQIRTEVSGVVLRSR